MLAMIVPCALLTSCPACFLNLLDVPEVLCLLIGFLLNARELQDQGKKVIIRGIEKLSTIVLLRILALLRKPMLIQHRMNLVQEEAAYVARALSEAGCKILSSPGSAIICFLVGM